MCVARIRSRKGAIIVSPREGAKDGPTQPYPTPRPNGRGPERPLLSHRRCLRAAQPEREALRASQAALGLGDHHPRPLATASRRGVGALLLARHPEVFLSSVPRGGRASPFLVAPPGEEAQALRMEPLRRGIVPELVGDPETLLIDSTLLAALHPRQVAQGSGFPGAAWVRWGSFSVYGVKLLSFSHALRHQRGAHLLRAHPRQRLGGAPDGGTARRGEPPRRSRPQSLRGPRLPKRSVGARFGRVRDLFGDREGRP